MTQPGQHILIVGQHNAYRAVTEVILRRAGRRVTIAEDYDQAVAVLRSSLHPLVVHTNTNVIIPGEEYCSMLFTLLANADFAATHAFVASSALSGDREDAIRDRIARVGAGYVGWIRLPAKATEIMMAEVAAELWLRARP